MSELKLVVAGAAGRMGRVLIQTAIETSGVTVSAALARPGSLALGQDAGLLAGCGEINVPITEDALAAIVDADGILDFTSPDLSVELAALAAQARIVHIIGTTGFSVAHLTKIEAAARHAVIVRSGNMSLGVNLLAALVKKTAAVLGPVYDIEIAEMHHRMKVDAPSGTALLLGEAAAQGRGISLSEHEQRGRDGHTGPRKDGDIGFVSLRGGTVVGDHTVIFAGPGERIELAHRAEDRRIFGRGAVQAALWGKGRKPGLYSMLDVLGLGGE
ncbi:4-hydroxy-tetrahydrodipicolinate reductase [Beijerinckia indica]|uniref:4-hydroxy-tetrahydrodipicolinate reductase n=1 Tax=Beijerinckia indica subsp. indica (strain ATCC 9039 / DSM 1715 / NCIMB 8712) TaxID=395963 RepID=DAPB_BEII9|nr:4-hydroxy-tetrahydrodipicolinate reductase [Beijerinckia indica]B2IBR8.1 RecName: Full=4-hydroxy-tetrahydrodipicolinate reductase; Short=HTPA reductase [Beijerinckia indica subsp. indica ATCC 9039]ACB93790.1 Dihydrodipicolinate reductase [Beijerinckia indica subsp. indica ATCC 9039]